MLRAIYGGNSGKIEEKNKLRVCKALQESEHNISCESRVSAMVGKCWEILWRKNEKPSTMKREKKDTSRRSGSARRVRYHKGIK